MLRDKNKNKNAYRVNFDANANVTHAQKEALINEMKGNLFEYLVGEALAHHYGIEKDFIEGLPLNLRTQLTRYEAWLRKGDPHLLSRLPFLSQKVARALVPRLPKEVRKVRTIGKIAGASHDQTWNEADILVDQIPISLKLCKDHSYVNTKSGGVRSFLSKYFGHLPGHGEWQRTLEQAVEQNFLRMAFELYEAMGLEFRGGFDEQWAQAGLSELPGQLPRDLSTPVFHYYARVVAVIHQAFVSFKREAEEDFIQALCPLLGWGNPRIIQTTCFHRGCYQLGRISIWDFDALNGQLQKGVELKSLRPGQGFFEIRVGTSLLQIRLKPMNKFTVPALKVNCSVKTFLLR